MVRPNQEAECNMVADAGFKNTGPDGDGCDSASPQAGEESIDMRRLARDWITLWQSELNAMAADPEMHETWQSVLALWAGGMASMLRAAPRESAVRREPSGRGTGAADPPRPQAAAAAPDPRDAEIERLGRHVASLERRFAELEHGSRVPVDPKRRRPRRA
jgi:hypothetical protein